MTDAEKIIKGFNMMKEACHPATKWCYQRCPIHNICFQYFDESPSEWWLEEKETEKCS